MDAARETRITALKTYLEEDPADDFSLYALALEYSEGGQNDDAIACFEDVLHHNSAFLAAYYHLGRACEKAGKKERALEAYETGIVVAKEQKNQRTENELRTALYSLREEDEI